MTTQHKSYTSMGWFMFVLAALFYALDYFQHTAPSVLIMPIAHSMNISFIDIGKIMSIYFPIYALSQIPAGYIIDKLGLKIALAIACLITSIGLITMTYPALTFLILGRTLIAIGSAFAFIGALKTADVWLPKQIFPIAVGITNTLGVMGGIIGKPILQQMIQSNNWQSAVLYISIFGFILTCVLFIFLRAPKKEKNNAAQQPQKLSFEFSIFKNIKLYLIAFYAGIMVGTIVNAFSELYDVVFLTHHFDMPTAKAATISSLMFVGIAVGGPLHGIIARFFKHTKTWMIIGCIGAILSFSGIVMTPHIAHTTVILSGLYFLSGFFVSTMLLAFSAARMHYNTSTHATIFAMINMIIGLCGFIFQWLLGHLIHITHGNFTTCLLLMLIPLLISLIFIILGVPKNKDAQEENLREHTT